MLLVDPVSSQKNKPMRTSQATTGHALFDWIPVFTGITGVRDCWNGGVWNHARVSFNRTDNVLVTQSACFFPLNVYNTDIN